MFGHVQKANFQDSFWVKSTTHTTYSSLDFFFSLSLLPSSFSFLVYKSGTEKTGRGQWDAFVGTWELGTRDKGLEDIKYGMRGHVGRGCGDVK